MTVLAIDFEASCLPRHGRSFPIEVGLASDRWTRSWLIRPHADWSDGHWTAEAEALHGIDRATIEREGMPADVVLAELAQTAGEARIVADSRLDQYWLEQLAAAARRPPPFAIHHVALILEESGTDEAGIVAAVAAADRRCPQRHRAGSDALWLATLMAHLPAGPRHVAPVREPALGAA
ncbi:hypothetical protein J3E64_003726 [Sphingobium sp. OAS761]|nr:hypothetical protein [Sphingobium sp. OAS761]